MADTFTVQNNEAQSRFEVTLNGALAQIDYGRSGNSIIFTRTEVPAALEGKGIGGAMAKAALEYARTQQLEVVPLCPFVRSYIDRHAEYQPLVKSDSGGGWG